MLALIPPWALHNAEFWESINYRNKWFIKLRYGAAAMLFVILIFGVQILNLELTNTQYFWISLVTFSILGYNIAISKLTKYLLNSPLKLNPVHISVIQMALDLIALGILVYYTGGIETPLVLLFIFHMVIGGLILPGTIMYISAGAIILFFMLITYLEYFLIIPHHAIQGFLTAPFYTDFYYISAFNIIFAFVLIVTVVLANVIAKQLYRMQEKLLQSIDKIKEAEIEKEHYMMGVVHEIKTPIAAVQSYLDVILQKYAGPIDPQVEEKLKRIHKRVDEAIQMINTVLKISRVKLLDEIMQEDIDIKRLISAVYSKHKDKIKNKRVCFKFDDSRIQKKHIVGDNFLLEMALSNIFSNAIKYVHNEGKVSVYLTEDEGKVFIIIMDNGIGIPEGEEILIFEQFYRASNIKQKYEGAGLGLSVVKQVIERHGGHIKVESPSPLKEEGHPGTSFIVTLPTK